MPERVRGYVEIVGVLSLIASLVFVGYEVKLTRDMNLVELHFNRMSLYHERFTTMIESDSYLDYHVKTQLQEWDYGDLTPREAALDEITVYNLLVEFEYEFRLVQAGFSLRQLDELRADLVGNLELYRSSYAVYQIWSQDPRYEFHNFMMQAFAEVEFDETN